MGTQGDAEHGHRAAAGGAGLTWFACLLALATSAGSVYLSMGMGLKACPLCFYQRTFALSVAAVLAMGLLMRLGRTGRLSLLALPLALGGLGVALFHVSLELNGTLECPKGLLSVGTAPQQSALMFAALFTILLADEWGGAGSNVGKGFRLIPALALGALLAVASCVANPPLPRAPDRPYPEPPDICRPPYHG